MVQVVPGQAGGGSFKVETLIACRAGQRLGLQDAGRRSVLDSNNLSTCHMFGFSHLK